MKKYLEMFWVFFKIGVFTIGGGFTMIPLIEAEVVENKKWIKKEEFVDTLALAQSSPGSIAVNIAVFIGFKIDRYKGAFFTAMGAILPSFLILLFIAMFFREIKNLRAVENAFKAIRPAVVALIAASVISLSKSSKLKGKAYIIPIAIALCVAFLKVTPILFIILAAIGGNLYMHWNENNQSNGDDNVNSNKGVCHNNKIDGLYGDKIKNDNRDDYESNNEELSSGDTDSGKGENGR
ncbi:MAG: chromate transporter [Clostridiales bacterium]|nr:chromate transporter [Clostridiales bacterium]